MDIVCMGTLVDTAAQVVGPLVDTAAQVVGPLHHGIVAMPLLQDSTGIAKIVNKLTTEVKAVMVAIGILGILLWVVAQLAAPMLPDWAQGMKGYFQKAMIALVVAGFGPTLVDWLYKLGTQ